MLNRVGPLRKMNVFNVELLTTQHSVHVLLEDQQVGISQARDYGYLFLPCFGVCYFSVSFV